jgi:hypothetical protein
MLDLVVTMKITIFYDVTDCLVDIFQHLEKFAVSSVLMLEAPP